MTLVMTAGIGSTFTVMTSDERISFNFGEFIIPDESGSLLKNYSLTDKVLFGWGGAQELADEVREKLMRVVRPSDDLKTCRRYLEEITDNMDSFTHRHAAILLTGFYADGSSGMVSLGTGLQLKELKMENLNYRHAILSPVEDYSDRQTELLHIEAFTPSVILEEFPALGYAEWLKKSIEIAVNHLIHLHGVISFQQPRYVTPEGFYYVRYKDSEGKIKTASAAYDASSVHEQLRGQGLQ